MLEFENFIKECHRSFKSCNNCADNCPIDHYCLKCSKNECDCAACMAYIQFNVSPIFPYSCRKITFHYVLQFFNRFASEISYSLRLWKSTKCKTISIASLGCGPGSEIFGIIDAFRTVAPNFTISYQGYDMNNIWEEVQKLCVDAFSQSPHNIEFYTMDMFAGWQGGETVDVLIMNYLLSDAVKFQAKGQKEQFLQDISNFIIDKNVKLILFNDINYYGHDDQLDSGVQMMRFLIKNIKNRIRKANGKYLCFPGDPYSGGMKWRQYTSNSLLFPLLKENKEVKCNQYCGSKQILLILEHL